MKGESLAISYCEQIIVCEWMSDCCLTPLISWREQINFQWYDDDDDEVHFVLDQHV
jgi:hypothetical protein